MALKCEVPVTVSSSVIIAIFVLNVSDDTQKVCFIFSGSKFIGDGIRDIHRIGIVYGEFCTTGIGGNRNYIVKPLKALEDFDKRSRPLSATSII